MSGQAMRFAAVAVLSASASIMMLLPTGAAPKSADNCLTAPNGTTPKGAHWKYRIEWPSQRKCWRLVHGDQKEAPVAAKSAPVPQGDSDDEPETVSAPMKITPTPRVVAAKPAPAPAPVFRQAPAPAAVAPAAAVAAKPEPAPAAPAAAATPPVKTLVTRNVSNSDDNPAWPEPPGAKTQTAEIAPPAAERTESEAPSRTAAETPAPAPVAAATPAPQPVATTPATPAPAAGGGPSWQLLIAAFAVLALLTAAAGIAIEMMRRRSDVLNAQMADEAVNEQDYEPEQLHDDAHPIEPSFEDTRYAAATFVPRDLDAPHELDETRDLAATGDLEETRDLEAPLDADVRDPQPEAADAEPVTSFPPLPPIKPFSVSGSKKEDLDEAFRLLLGRRHAA